MLYDMLYIIQASDSCLLGPLVGLDLVRSLFS